MIEAPDNILKINTDLPVSKDMPITEDDSFSYDGFQVVRGEFFAHLNEPSISFASGKVYVNSACIRKLPNAEFVQILVNAEEKRLVVRPCKEEEKDSFRWCSTRRTPRQIKCTIFFAKIMQLMEWNPDYRYKLLGKLVRSRDQLLFVFDLTAPEIFIRTRADGRLVSSAAPVYPEEWNNRFGVPYEEHQRTLQINIFEGYAVFGIGKKKPSA